MLKLLTVFGTRPETIKMAPLIAEMARLDGAVVNKTCFTGQHRDMVRPLIELFGIKVDYGLDLMLENQSLEYLTVRVLEELGRVLRAERFDYVLVQGDTTTSMAASLAAYYSGTKVGHVEAGLRTYDKSQPYPEEVNRRIIDAVADLYFAHTEHAKQNLSREGVPQARIAVTGNTVIDALLAVANRQYSFDNQRLDKIVRDGRRIVLVTAHRRESFGAPFRSICAGLKRLALEHRDVLIVYPVHRNPNVRAVVGETLASIPNVVLLEPLDYLPFVHLMKKSYLLLTDSGGVQEEAPSLDKPVLVMRNVTERQEGLAAGTIRLVGTDAETIATETARLLTDRAAYDDMAFRENPYGDGTAAVRTMKRILEEAGA